MADLLHPEIRIEVEDDEYVHIVAEPLERGYGTTLGNSLRRVLLSSLPGAAITSVRIEGVEHEFSTVPGMKEDVTEFLLNLKEVRLRAYADRPARLFLEVSGEGPVTAGQIQATADYDIVNPDLRLATLDTKDATLVVDLNVESGRGYLPATVSEGLPIGVIPVDALFSPVRRVNYKVSNTRVGQDTNYDKLDLEIWTDGTINGQTAVAMAAEMLREQFYPFQLLGRPEAVAEPAVRTEDAPFEGHDMPIEALDLSVRAYNCLKRSGLTTVGVVLEKSEEELLALRNFGEKSYLELRDKLIAHGFPAPRTESRRPTDAPAPAVRAAVEDEDEVDADGQVGALGAALMEALKEAGRNKDA
ncbi:MAG: DNA-directed RNA polymerase subunit alpha [Dehalococcoidia bacterium]|nr:DNA-directed RNA polymerase subunit alpha [Dehalococcoidia bacterium]